jgi:hypothetical protein
LASGLLDSSGDLNFHGRGTREEIIDDMMATARAWGSRLSRAEAASIADKAIRRPTKALTLVLLAAICFALWIM